MVIGLVYSPVDDWGSCAELFGDRQRIGPVTTEKARPRRAFLFVMPRLQQKCIMRQAWGRISL